ncbi:SDR family NAD(P)-dependent oxidoreductase [Maricaulis sp.]|uniref:SDR family NAD(P)-dependent oxidoreductase n=1 Tax=Maricaulis sp. TaxID=1486257 RepID=UPI000C58C647|nr:SDR family NAD(P)-dependent oxidoreductase [Maricaulis sp.]MAC89633.1 acetoin dehydrogenase [Maricaulis sp.]
MSRRFDYSGRTALITGAASGIGAALAAGLAARGASLILVDINADGLDGVAAPLRADGCAVSTFVVDMADAAAIARLAKDVEASGAPVHLLFNNAGIALGGMFEDVEMADFERLIDINLYGVIRMSRAFLPRMRAVDEAHIVNISSIFGIVAPAGQAAYSTAKFGVKGFSNALRHELAGSSIGVTTVHPGGVATQIAASAKSPPGASPEEMEAARKQTQRLLVMPPAEAARIILDGVARRKPRIFVGRDAHTMMWLERIFPTRYWSLMQKMVGAKRAS